MTRDYESTNIEAAAWLAEEEGGPVDRDEYVPDPPRWMEPPVVAACGVTRRGEPVGGGCGGTLSTAEQQDPYGAAAGYGALWHPGCLRAEQERRGDLPDWIEQLALTATVGELKEVA